jgi:hypothetical protein
MMRTQRSILFGAVFACAIAAVAPDVHAQQATTTGTATVLFDEAVALMQRGQYAAACPKLVRSNELSPNGGTLFALAECYERNGQIASAWVTYNEAAIRAGAAKRTEAQTTATEAAERLAPSVSRLIIQVPSSSAVDGLAVTLDGRPVAQAEWGVATPIDPGPHKIQASAPSRLATSREISFDRVAAQKVVSLPMLEPAPVPVADEGPPRGRTQRIAGVVMSGVGLAGLAVGTVFGLRASSRNNDAAAHCSSNNACDAEGIRLDSEGRDAATISTIAFIAGGALAVGGLVVVLTAPSGSGSAPGPAEQPPQTASFGLKGAPGGAAFTFGATF